ncbi:MAG: hypothetical protein IPM98_13750 [Lewinellaceae bacterium]|nr:hypothetical protein [Lewinellaceae bacterium]
MSNGGSQVGSIGHARLQDKQPGDEAWGYGIKYFIRFQEIEKLKNMDPAPS